MKEIISARVEINKMNRKSYRINQSWFFENLSETNEPFIKLT